MDLVKLEQIRIIHRLSKPNLVLSVLVALVLAVVFYPLVGIVFVSVWVATLVLATYSRYLLGRYFEQYESRHSPSFWALTQCLGSFCTSLIWVAFTLTFDVSWPAVYQTILVVAVTALIAGAIGAHSSYYLSLLCFYTPIVLAVMWISVAGAEQGFWALFPLSVLFWVVVHISGRRFSAVLTANIRMQQNLSAANEQLELVSRLDSLTQLQNRGALETYLSATWEEYQQSQRPVSVAMIDVDMFKAYNDHYGHLQGDRCLTRVANVLRLVIPEELGFVGRYGGEEFIAVLPGVTKLEAQRWIDNARQALLRERIEHLSSTVSDYVTVSVGIESAVPVADEDWMELIDRADAKLYIAKQRGRDQVVL